MESFDGCSGVELSGGLSKIMEFEGFGRRAKVTSQSSQSHQHLAMMIINDNMKNGLKEIVENDLISSFSLFQHMFQRKQNGIRAWRIFVARWEQKKSVGVTVNGEMIEYNDIFSYYILRSWAISIGRLSHIIFIFINYDFPLFVSPSVLQKEKNHIEGFALEMRTKVSGTIVVVECTLAWNC
ncbi:hypothetical protein QQP08_000808 [Theobroma cacao]|nr:hypothetical protein QQP08_000808 [Theobroma cacao]